MVKGIKMQKATGNYCIKDSESTPSTINMTTTNHINHITDHGIRIPRSGREGQSQDGKAFSVASRRNPCHYSVKLNLTICAWNVKTLYEADKTHNAIKTGQCKINDHHIYYSGNPNGRHENGVGIILNQETARHVKNFVRISERILLLQLNTYPITPNIIQVYAPTADKPDEISEAFYNELSTP
ncbi:uncharacterized protein [Diabrotica undecimpunctata]|uniref:uncharacterized protein n=1 Tax=Diabrotica undecimpunctata TaxID=50387 RepID=UPI003B63E860